MREPSGGLEIGLLEDVRVVDATLELTVEAEVDHLLEPLAIAAEELGQGRLVAGGGIGEELGQIGRFGHDGSSRAQSAASILIRAEAPRFSASISVRFTGSASMAVSPAIASRDAARGRRTSGTGGSRRRVRGRPWLFVNCVKRQVPLGAKRLREIASPAKSRCALR